MTQKNFNRKMGKIIQVDEEGVKDHLGEIVKGTVQETLNAMLDAEADHLCNAQRYERSAGRKDTRAGSYRRKLHTRAGEVEITVPKLRALPFETAIIERYRRRETSVEEALVEMYLAGVSVRRVEDITEALWGTKVSSGTVSRLNSKIYETIEKWRMSPIEGEHPYIYLDGISMKRSWSGEVKNVSILVAIGGEQGRLSGDTGCCRRGERGQGELEYLPAVSEGTWPERCRTDYIGQVSGAN